MHTNEAAVLVVLAFDDVVDLNGMATGGADGLYLVVGLVPTFFDGLLLAELGTRDIRTLEVTFFEVNEDSTEKLWYEMAAKLVLLLDSIDIRLGNMNPWGLTVLVVFLILFFHPREVHLDTSPMLWVVGVGYTGTEGMITTGENVGIVIGGIIDVGSDTLEFIAVFVVDAHFMDDLSDENLVPLHLALVGEGTAAGVVILDGALGANLHL